MSSGLRPLGLILILSLLSGCSSLRSHYSMVPVEEAEWKTQGDGAAYRSEAFEINIRVPISGTWQHSMGPCLLPAIPITRDLPQPLQIWIRVQAKSSAKVQLNRNDWVAVLRAQEFGETFPDDIEIRSQVASDSLEQLEDGSVRYRFVFSHFDNEFEDFILKGSILVNGKKVDLPALAFERESDLDYTPYTTKILDLM